MTFAEKLRTVRKQAGMSQEKLAERIGVSRQEIAKWETETGIPDIENIMALSALFDNSIDELFSNEKGMNIQTEYLFESVTEYDIDEPKRYDMRFGGSKQLVLSGYNGEKIRIRLVSNTLSTLVVFLVAGLLVATNKEMFYEKEYIGNLLKDNEMAH